MAATLGGPTYRLAKFGLTEPFVSFWKMGEVTGERRYWEGALAILKSLEARGALLAMDQPMIAALETFLGRPATEQKQRR